MDRLNPLDAAFIDAEDEDRHTSMAIASIAVFEGPAPSYEEFYQAVAGRLPLVPGPQVPLYGAGRKLLEIIPYVPIATTVRTGVSIFTYCGQVTFGVTGDFAANPDLDVLARGIEGGISDLRAAARRRRQAPRKAIRP